MKKRVRLLSSRLVYKIESAVLTVVHFRQQLILITYISFCKALKSKSGKRFYLAFPAFGILPAHKFREHSPYRITESAVRHPAALSKPSF